jgi:hypothetical protein
MCPHRAFPRVEIESEFRYGVNNDPDELTLDMMKLSDVINEQWLDAKCLADQYRTAKPFPHIVLREFIRSDILEKVAAEFPDLSKLTDSVKSFDDIRETKLAGVGWEVLSPSAIHLSTYLQSDLMMS